MKALSIRQPWASLIVSGPRAQDWGNLLSGPKRVENRTWPTKHRGWFLVHASQKRERRYDYNDTIANLPTGVVIGAARIVACAHIDDILSGAYDERFPWLRKHWHASGPWCFVLDEVVEFRKPFQVKGRLGFFDVPMPGEVLP